MFTVERRVGCVVEARVHALRNGADGDAYFQAITRVVLEVQAPARAVICADHRPVVIYPPEVADKLVQLFTSVNTRVQRAALLVTPTNATVNMQLARIVRESDNPNRQVFRELERFTAFLGEVLDAAELARVRAFMGEG
jgi:hypothetical protein